MPAFKAGQLYIYFAHCPKAGGTSIEKYATALFGRLDHCNHRWDRAWFDKSVRGWACFDPPCSPQHLTWRDVEGVLARRPDMIFTVVRDPVIRMVSEYLYQRHERRTTRIGKIFRRIDFSTWLRVMRRCHAANPYVFDNHLCPQVEFFPQSSEVRIYRLEDGLSEPFAWIDGLAPDRNAQGSPVHALKSKHARPTPSRQDLSLIATYWQEDYERLGYALPDLASVYVDRLAPLRELAAMILAPVIGKLYRYGRL